MVDEPLNDVITRVIQDRETVESIIEWEAGEEEQKDRVFEVLKSLPYNQLADLRRAMDHFNQGLDKAIEYWPLLYTNRVASHYYDIKAVDAAQEAATTASKSAKISTMAFWVSAGALVVAAGTFLWNITL